MSLLMDALKKAELAKRNAPPDSASSPASPRAAPAVQTPVAASPSTSRPERLPSLPDRLEILDGEFETPSPAGVKPEPEAAPHPALAAATFSLQEDAAPAVVAPTPAFVSREAENASQRDAVQNLFETKQTPASRKTFVIGVSVAALLAALAIGGYFWYQLQPKSGLRSLSAQNSPSRPLSPPPSASPITPSLAVGDNNAVQFGATTADPVAKKSPAEQTAPAEPSVQLPVVKKLFQVSKEVQPANPGLNGAYDALTRGDDASAKAGYEQALGRDPKNADALAGMAVLAQRSGDSSAAADYYLKMLDADPKSATALAGLMDLQSRMDPAVAETRIKQALAQQPDSPALNFSLGNVYARGKHWNEAQQAYFKASSTDPGNPDYLFNLAVSLDQLRQPKLAANYYAQAIAAASSRPASFDKARASERLQQLQQ